MQSELRDPSFQIYEEDEEIGGMGLINHLVKDCFVQGLVNERIQKIMRATSESLKLSERTDATQEVSAILSVKERGFAPQILIRFPKKPVGQEVTIEV
jgi:hypothetical protein